MAVLLLAVLTLTVYLGSAFHPALFDDADAGHAEAAREMIQRHDWVTLHINGVRYLEKPPLLFWTAAIAYRLLGVNEVATRLPLILAVLGLVLIGAAFGKRAAGELAGFYAGLALATSFGIYLFTRAFIADVLLTCCITAAMYCFWRARSTLPGRFLSASGLWALGFWAALAAAVLAKGLIGIVFPLGAAGLYILVAREWRAIGRLRPVTGTALFLLLAAPWHILASIRTPHFAWFYFVNEHFLRYLGKRFPHDYDKVPLAVFWLGNLAWLFPWSVFLPLAFRKNRESHLATYEAQAPGQADAGAERRSARLLWWIWAGVVLVFFSFSTRQEYYTMPAYPALALLLADALGRAEQQSEVAAATPRAGGLRLLVWVQAIPAAVGALAAGGLVALLWLSRNVRATGDISSLLTSNPDYYKLSLGHMFDLRTESFAALRWPAASAALVLAAGFPLAWWFRRRGRHLRATLTTAFTAAAFLLCAHAALVVFEPYLSSRPLAAAIQKAWRPGDRIVVDGEYYAASSVGFYLQPKLFLLNGRMTGLEFGSHYPDCPPVFIADGDIQKWWKDRGRVFLITDRVKRERIEKLLGASQLRLVAESGGKFVFTNHAPVQEEPLN